MFSLKCKLNEHNYIKISNHRHSPSISLGVLDGVLFFLKVEAPKQPQLIMILVCNVTTLLLCLHYLQYYNISKVSLIHTFQFQTQGDISTQTAKAWEFGRKKLKRHSNNWESKNMKFFLTE